ncbi:MAG TPA: poly-beta-1,6-N-acetyl-D-glucosamine biosynthesis protein PgaD [Xanthomonadaceae bacterium]|nr:poly-beta-1,6-N-acetyl-D-glucosamine biosynthesis protein PgaD [Xanthomonadaceae bacterium]
MRERFIIIARRNLRRRHRWLSDVLTAGLWIGWMLLWLPVVRKLREVVRLHVDFELAAREVLDVVTPISITHSLLALIGTVALLLLWSRLSKRKAGHAQGTLSIADYARHFDLPEAEIDAGRASRVCVVAHDDAGAVTGIRVVE